MAQIQKSTILKLRQNEGILTQGTDPSIGINGAYNITLNKPVNLETGDMVRLHTAILDSSAPQVIDIKNDIEIEIDVCRYLTYYDNIVIPVGPVGPQTPTPHPMNFIYKRVGVPAFPAQTPAEGATPVTDGDNQQYTPTNAKYWAGRLSDTTGKDTYKVLKVKFYQSIPFAKKWKDWGNIMTNFEYTDPTTGKKMSHPVRIPPLSFAGGGDQGEYNATINLDVVGNEPGDFRLTTKQSILDGAGVEGMVKITFGPKIEPVPGTDPTLFSSPYIETLKITLPARRYQPGELCSVINDSMSLLNLQGKTGMDTENNPSTLYPTQNPFLGTVRQMEENIQKDSTNTLAFFREVDNFTDRVTEMITIDTASLEGANNDLWCGANQVELNYDPVLQKINFSILHFPIYVPITGTEFVPGVKYDTFTGAVTTTFSGVTLMGLRPQSFWEETMGFNTLTNTFQNEFLPFRETPVSYNSTTGVKYPGSGAGAWIHPFKMIGTPGLNITDVFLGIDLPVTKDASFFGVANGDTAVKVDNTATSLTLPIFSTRVFNSPVNDEGYFLIEIGFAFAQKMVGAADVYNNIQSIVGKYFTSDGNFLQDQGSGTINYQHLGNPQMLTDISVRILNPDGSLLPDTVLGPKNSVFLEIIKTLNLPAQKTTLVKK